MQKTITIKMHQTSLCFLSGFVFLLGIKVTILTILAVLELAMWPRLASKTPLVSAGTTGVCHHELPERIF